MLGVTIDDARAIAATLPRSYEALVRDEVRFRVGRIVEADEVRALKEASSADLLIGGPGLAAHALRAGVVDEVRLVLAPVALGAGKPAFPTDLRLDLELIEERRFGNGAVHVAYASAADLGWFGRQRCPHKLARKHGVGGVEAWRGDVRRSGVHHTC